MKRFFLSVLIFAVTVGFSQEQHSASDILHELKKLQNPTRVLYLAAHPDDENTKMISWLVNEKGANTAYLSLTRGDGGQNLIGSELGAKLGVLRTQELMQARNLDGGQQFFSRAVDFGYSKSARETLEKWGEDEILSDVVWVIRKFRPDVIITRFPPDGRGGHGHHTASALLGMKAFDLAAREDMFPEQLKHVETWQPKRMYWNTSRWWNRDLDSIAKGNPEYLKVDIGGYNPIIGMSNNELASLSRTQHKSQGFGVSVARGSETEYLQFLAGEKVQADLFEGIDQSWERYGFKNGGKDLQKIIESFDPAAPSESIDALFALRAKAGKINDEHQRRYFTGQIDEIIAMSLGWHVEILAPEEFVQKGDEMELSLEAINRSPAEVQVQGLKIGEQQVELSEAVEQNKNFSHKFTYQVTGNVSQPYWLRGYYENLFAVPDQQLIGRPENDPAINGLLSLQVNGKEVQVRVPVVYKFSDRVEGEIVRPVFITPELIVNPDKTNMIFVAGQSQELSLQFRFFANRKITVRIKAQGWQIEPSELQLSPEEEVEYIIKKVKVTPLENSDNVDLEISLEGGEVLQSLTEISYEHIDKRLVFEDGRIPLINLDLKTAGNKVGYIPGAGDEVADAIAQMGYEVVFLDEDKIRNQDLSQYQAIVAGIRAYNTREWLPGLKPRLMEYIKNGGNYIVQYNTASRDLLSQNIGPYPFEITRNRVTEEDAEPQFTIPSHLVLNTPNKLDPGDFENWVQERGLYFAGDWDERYQTPIGWHDEGDEMQQGALIIGNSGKGAFIYTGISFFRELPAAVPGAYRLLANLISYQNENGDEQ